MRIEKKVDKPYFDKILNGDKKFELRLADFECEPGDIMILKEWDPEKEEYTGRKIEKEVNYVLKTKNLDFWSQEEIDKYGYQVISF